MNNNAYLSFLSKLVPKIPIIDSSTDHQILHLDESHTNIYQQDNSAKSERIPYKPSLVKGAKAFHLSKGRELASKRQGLKSA